MSTAPVSEPRASPLPATWPWGRLVDAFLVLTAAASLFLWGASWLEHRRFPGTTRPTADVETVRRLEGLLSGQQLGSIPVTSSKGSNGTFNPADGPAVLIFFSSTCPVCRVTAPRWQRLLASLPPGIRRIAVAGEDSTVARTWIDAHGLAIDQIVFPSLPTPWGVAAVPTTLVVDRGGRVVEVKVGLFDDSMETALGTKARAAMLSTIHPGGNR